MNNSDRIIRTYLNELKRIGGSALLFGNPSLTASFAPDMYPVEVQCWARTESGTVQFASIPWSAFHEVIARIWAVSGHGSQEEEDLVDCVPNSQPFRIDDHNCRLCMTESSHYMIELI